jgi:hypothetical protein
MKWYLLVRHECVLYCTLCSGYFLCLMKWVYSSWSAWSGHFISLVRVPGMFLLLSLWRASINTVPSLLISRGCVASLGIFYILHPILLYIRYHGLRVPRPGRSNRWDLYPLLIPLLAYGNRIQLPKSRISSSVWYWCYRFRNKQTLLHT